MASSASPRYYFLRVNVNMIIVTLIFLSLFLCNLGDGATINYTEALQKAVLFFRGQRSGKLPNPFGKGLLENNYWRGDSALNDGLIANRNLRGGYYDAGDNEKFNFPMAYSTTMLTWSVIEFGRHMRADTLKDTLEAIEWATDYLLKCASDVAKREVLYVGVGDGNLDHTCWERPEDIDKDLSGGARWRTVYSVSPSSPGSEVAAEMAAALAAASIVFRKVDREAYSRKLLETAELVFDFANKYRGSYSNNFYPSYSGYNDELIWGAAWLYKATKNEKYANLIESLGDFTPPSMASWDNKYAAASILMSRKYLSKKNSDPSYRAYSEKAEAFMCGVIYNPSYHTKGGLLYLNLGGSNLQYVTGMTFLMVTYGKYMAKHTFSCSGSSDIVSSRTLKNLAQTQVDYILGNNPMKMSYMVGYGSKYPKKIHHRASSIFSIHDHPNTIIGCQDSFLQSSSANPNELTGAIVGGPDGKELYQDDRNNYAQSEPTTYINAPFVGTLARLAAKPK